MMRLAVIAVGYNRPDSMKRLLHSILNAYYSQDEVDLIISIDKGERQKEIIAVAEEIQWTYGNKTIRAFNERLGLRKHILQCGDISINYDAIIVLEDDLEVSRFYLEYVKQMIRHWGDDERIAGISLYKHVIHPGVHRFFEPVNNGYDVFLMQFAMSWGQCWTKQMWMGFKEWYLKNESSDLSKGNLIPDYISKWNSQSWLKYYMRYIVDTDKYFVYPYVALSTNASDAGEHCSIPNNDFQISLLQGSMEYRMPSFDEAVRYDVFFERVDIIKQLEEKYGKKVVLDLYGSKSEIQSTKGLLFSTKCWPYKKLQEIKLKLRPIEMNCLYPEIGMGIKVYDLETHDGTNEANNIDVLTRYDVRSISWKKIIHLGFKMFVDTLVSKIRINKR